MAEAGFAARRKAEELIVSGRVRVNGVVVDKLGSRIDPQKDKVSVDGKFIKQKEPKVYIKLYKPRGVVSSCRKYPKEKTILDLVKDIPYRLFPVGRLDKDSEGLMLLTNDGELANRLMHPRYEHEKEYLINVQFPMTNGQLRNLQSGIVIDGKKTLPIKVKRDREKTFSMILREGKKRQIRKMVEAAGNRVASLKRVRIKNINLGNLASGEYSYLTASEIKGLVI